MPDVPDFIGTCSRAFLKLSVTSLANNTDSNGHRVRLTKITTVSSVAVIMDIGISYYTKPHFAQP